MPDRIRNFKSKGKVFIECDMDCGSDQFEDLSQEVAYPLRITPVGHNHPAPVCAAQGAPNQDGGNAYTNNVLNCRVCLIKANQRGLKFKEI